MLETDGLGIGMCCMGLSRLCSITTCAVPSVILQMQV
jgi:hypothetical protein